MMDVEELRKLIAPNEGETVEVKETTGQRGDACKTLCAFLNKRGGTVVFGVTPKGKLTGQLMSDSTKRDLFDAFKKFEPAADIEVSYVPVDETHTAIVCHVDQGFARPYVYDGTPYKRIQSSTTVMPQEEYERMLLDRGGYRSRWESLPNPELSLDDLDQEQIRATARRAVRCGRLEGDTDVENVEGLLDGFKIRKDGVLLNAAAVLFGRKEKIDYPQLEVKMGWFRGTTDREFRDIRHRQGNIFQLIEESMAFCFKHLNLSAKINGKIERDDELEIPADALREVLINAFAHRSYEDSGRTVYLAIYDDRVEIKNPGRLPAEFDVAHLYSPPVRNSVLRNEKIARVLYLRKTIETWGRGFTRIADECKRVGLPLPTTTVEYGNVLTVFQRPDWVGTGTTTQITGTDPQITGTRWVLKYTDPFSHLPKMRRDAKENAETVLHEIISDKNATFAQICARTGMALRTINNALATLREAKIIELCTDTQSDTQGDTQGDTQADRQGKMEHQIIEFIQQDAKIGVKRMAERLGVSIVTVKRRIAKMPNVRFVGHGYSGHWEVVS